MKKASVVGGFRVEVVLEQRHDTCVSLRAGLPVCECVRARVNVSNSSS